MRLRRLLIVSLLLLSACGSQPSALATLSLPIRQNNGDVQTLALADLPRYELIVEARPEESSLSGQVTIRYLNTAPAELRELYFRLYPNMKMYGGHLDVLRAAVDGREVPFVVAGKDVDLKVPLPRTLPPRRAATVEIEFALSFPELQSEYDFFGQREGVVVLPDFYPMLAPLIGGEWRLDPSPGYGDAAFTPVSLYELEVKVPEGYLALAPGMVVEERAAEGSVTYRIASGLVRNIGLVLARGYEEQELQAGDVMLVSYALPQDRTAARAALWHAAAALSYCEDNLGPIPAKRLLLVRVPLVQAGVQVSGMVLLGSRDFGEQRPELERSVVQGICRAWWGLKVGADPLRDPWLDEALVAYTTFLYLRQTHGPEAGAAIIRAWQESYDDAVLAKLDARLVQPLSAYGNSARYELLVGSKGPLFWLGLEELLGEQGALAIMRQSQQGYAYGALDTAGLITTVERLAGPPAEPLVEQWLSGIRQQAPATEEAP